MRKKMDEFEKEREDLNEIVMKYADLSTKRFYGLDARVYRDGALPNKTKEMLGLVASLVLRCDDCIQYHVAQCHEQGINKEEMAEIMSVGLVVGGSITIPHMRRAFAIWDELDK